MIMVTYVQLSKFQASVRGYLDRKRTAAKRKLNKQLFDFLRHPCDIDFGKMHVPKMSEIVLDRLKDLKKFEYSSFFNKVAKKPVLERREPTLLDNGNVYIGEWDKTSNKRSGRGKIIFKNGAIFEGHFLNNKVNGYGRHIKTDGEQYEGEWKDDCLHGQGLLINTNGSSYKG
jgi:hypothetical protein